MALSPFVRRVATRFKDAIVAAWGDRILEVRVFGSMARGDAHEDSDFDIFVKVVDKARPLVRSIVNAACIVSEEETDYRPALSPLIMSREHFD
jgi:predicted nucleotidyltransferase